MSVALNTSAVCEACGKPFSYRTVVERRAQEWGDARSMFGVYVPGPTGVARQDLRASVAKRLANRELGHRPCPTCGELPSWQRRSFLFALPTTTFLVSRNFMAATFQCSICGQRFCEFGLLAQSRSLAPLLRRPILAQRDP